MSSSPAGATTSRTGVRGGPRRPDRDGPRQCQAAGRSRAAESGEGRVPGRVSHELRTPSVILLWINFESEALESWPSRDDRPAQRSQLIDELLRCPDRGGKLNPSPHATNRRRSESVVRLLVHRPRRASAAPQCRATSRARGRIPACARPDNVLLNAAVHGGEVAVSQRVRCCACASRTRVNSAGGAALHLERFRQGDSSSTRGQGGLGLGLAIAKHRSAPWGRIEAWSDEARGSAFTIEIPEPLPVAHASALTRTLNVRSPAC
jgi:hypothetical protein